MQVNRKDFNKDNIRDGHYSGKVVDVEDPLNLGRIRVEVFGFFDGLDVNLIPWSSPGNGYTSGSSTGSGFLSIPKIGSIVDIQFDNGNIYNPVYLFHQRISNELREEIGDDRNAHSLIYDTENFIKIYYTSEKGLVLDLSETILNIRPDNSIIISNPNGDKIELSNDGNITVESKKSINVKSPEVIIDSSKRIELGKGATEDVILGNKFMSLFNLHTHVGALGVNTSPPITPMTSAQLSSGNGSPIVKTK